MGNGQTGRPKARAKLKRYKKARCTKFRGRDLDQIKDDLSGKKMSFAPGDDDLPGRGDFYCVPCARHFVNQAAVDKHATSKPHKRRLKLLNEDPYTQKDSDFAAGKTT